MIDLTAMLINLSNSLAPVQKLLSGFGYLVGITLMISGLLELKKHAESRGGQSSHEDALTALAFIFGGALLVYMTSTVTALSNTVFGATNILSYSVNSSPNLYHAMLVLIQTTGVLWFVRGMVLLVQSTKPGHKEGAKGMTFMLAGIGAINFESSMHVIDYVMQQFFIAMTYFKSNGGLLSLQ
jgi:uncharacterized membrane protein HdeD (DUF308 family)